MHSQLTLCDNNQSEGNKQIPSQLEVNNEMQKILTNQSREEENQISPLLLNVYVQLLNESRQNFLKIAQTSPMHGLLTSLRATMPVENLNNEFYQNLIEGLDESVQFMIKVLSGGKRDVKNASFAGKYILIHSRSSIIIT